MRTTIRSSGVSPRTHGRSSPRTPPRRSPAPRPPRRVHGAQRLLVDSRFLPVARATSQPAPPVRSAAQPRHRPRQRDPADPVSPCHASGKRRAAVTSSRPRASWARRCRAAGRGRAWRSRGQCCPPVPCAPHSGSPPTARSHVPEDRAAQNAARRGIIQRRRRRLHRRGHLPRRRSNVIHFSVVRSPPVSVVPVRHLRSPTDFIRSARAGHPHPEQTVLGRNRARVDRNRPRAFRVDRSPGTVHPERPARNRRTHRFPDGSAARPGHPGGPIDARA